MLKGSPKASTHKWGVFFVHPSQEADCPRNLGQKSIPSEMGWCTWLNKPLFDGWRKKIQCQWISLLRSRVFQFLWGSYGFFVSWTFLFGHHLGRQPIRFRCSRNLRENKVFKTSMHFTPPTASISGGIQRRPGNRESLDVPTDIAVRCKRRADFQTAKKGAKKPAFNISERFGDDSWQCDACCFFVSDLDDVKWC